MSILHVRLYEGPHPNGYIRGKGETLVWGIYCPSCSSGDNLSVTHMRLLHSIQHPNPGPAMDWARMHVWQHEMNDKMDARIAA